MDTNPDVAPVFHAVIDLDAADRAKYYAEHAVAPELQREVEALLSFDQAEVNPLHGIVQQAVGASFGASDEPWVKGRCGPYKLLRSIGRGGMGFVYLAERVDGEMRQQVAIKMLRLGMDGIQARQLFLQERQILANLSHPNITHLVDAGHRDDGQPYLAMEYVDGEPIDKYCELLPIRQRVELLLEVCAAVDYAHQNLIAHRDLKPSNILVGDDGRPKLLDFGIAKFMDEASDMTGNGERRLTPTYASPEQIRGEAVGTATDIYSLGAILYRLLAGVEPFQVTGSMTPSQLALAICEKPVTRPSELNPEVDKDLNAIVLKAMRKEPVERYATAGKFAADLRAWLDHRPVRARQGNWWYVARRSLRRHWVPATAVGIAIVTLAAGLLITLHERDIERRRFEAVRQLANKLLKVEGSIDNLPGSTEARERIVKIALEYLEQLSNESGNDVALKSELALAYRKVANIQGGFRRTNLGRPADAQISLRKAEALFRDAWKAAPASEPVLRDLISTVETQSRIDYGQRNEKDLEVRLGDLERLMPKYEQIAPDNPERWDFLSTIFDSLAIGLNHVQQPEKARKYSEQSVQYQKKLVAVQPTLGNRGNLSTSLSSYARILRADGDLDGALAALKQDVSILEEISKDQKKDVRITLNLAASYSTMADVVGEEDRIVSLGQYDAAQGWYERSLQYGRELGLLDPREVQVRYNTAAAALKYGNILRHKDPRRALLIYDESIELLRGMPAKAASRDLPLMIVLAESTFPLRKVGRFQEAKKRLAESKAIVESYKAAHQESPGMLLEAISRAEADQALTEGKFAEAAAIHLAWLEKIQYGGDSVERVLRNALLLARRLHLMAAAYAKAGKTQESAKAEAKRREVLKFWRARPASKKFITDYEAAGGT